MKRSVLSWLMLIGMGTPQVSASHDLSQLAWLSGCWRSESADDGSVEHWLPLAGETLIGVSRTVRAGKTVAFEYMQIRPESDGTLVFVAQPSGRPPTIFPLISLTAIEAVFENRANDFPQRIVYASADGHRLDARIEGVRHGEHRIVEFPMVRVRCDGPDDAFR